MKELIARIKIVLKRKTDIKDLNIIEYGDLQLNLRNGKILCNNNEITINGKELELLEILITNKNQTISRELLADKIWGYDSEAEYNNVEVYISFLRKKLKLLKSKTTIKTVRGIGYAMEVQND